MNCEVTFLAGAASAAPHCLLAREPHLISDDASRADCVRAFLFSGLRRINHQTAKPIVKLPLDRKLN